MSAGEDVPQMIPMLRGGRYRVVCTKHHLDRTVETEQHAKNLLDLHLRRDHAPADPSAMPATIDVTRLARWVLDLTKGKTSGPAPARAALGAWCEATGAPDDETALAWARAVLDAPGTITAVVPPF